MSRPEVDPDGSWVGCAICLGWAIVLVVLWGVLIRACEWAL